MTSGTRFVAVVACGVAAAALVSAVGRAEDVAEPAAPVPVPPAKLAPLPPAPVLLEQVMRGFLEAAPGRETLDEVMRRAAARNRAAAAEAEAAQRKQFIRQQAQQFEQMLQPLLNTELAFVRRACGSLPPEARQAVLAASRQGLREVAERIAREQFEGGADDRDVVEVREAIHARVAAAVEKRAAPEEFAAYEREWRQRHDRRAEAARVRIVAKLDEQLGLTAEQRRAMLEDLRAKWRPAWLCELDDHDGVIINDHPPAPDFADACIAPHLDAVQLRRWREWSEAAGAQMLSRGGIDWSDLNALQQGQVKQDAWWRP
jgi:hypothetical protein